jgi:ribosomal protein L40E
MAKKSRGFIQLEWECPQCESRNPGPAASCEQCGAPQPDDVEFVAPSERKFVQDEKKLEHAKAGADIICAFCDTRNIATAEVCSQCGADLGEGARRKSGGEVRQREAVTSVHCHNCDAENLSTDTICQQCGAPLAGASLTSAPVPSVRGLPKTPQQAKKSKIPAILGALLFILLCCVAALFFFVLSPSETVVGTVSDVRWETRVDVQAEREVTYTNERGNPPSDAYDVDCYTESEETCTDETVDQGNGYAEVVQNCETSTEQFCSYTVMEWQVTETLTRSGDDYNPYYAEPSLSAGERLGTEGLELLVTFSSEKGQLDYTPSDLNEYQQYRLGSDWTLSLNRIGSIVSVEP